MLKVIQLKIQEYTSCRKKNSKSAWFDIKRQAWLIETRICRILFQLELYLNVLGFKWNTTSTKLYKGNPQVFIRLFREKNVPLFVDLGFCTQKLSKVFYRCYSLKNCNIRYCRSCCIQDQCLRRSKTFE